MFNFNSKSLVIHFVICIISQLPDIFCIEEIACPTACEQMSCTIGALSCQKGGLKQIPTRIPKSINKVLFVNQLFVNPVLRRDMFNYYVQLTITKLTILNCTISDIYPETFKDFKSLQNLDLSKNKLTKIRPDTFKELTVDFLRLTGNPLKKLHRYAFRGLKITDKLSLDGCLLEEIKIETFQPIIKDLRKLDIIGNQLKTIQPNFEKFFLGVTQLQLGSNPYSCYCNLKWLTNLLRKRRKLGLQTDYPICKYPEIHNGNKLVSLLASDIICTKPELKELDITIYDVNKAKLTCIVKDDINDRQFLPRSYYHLSWYRNTKSHGEVIEYERINQSITEQTVAKLTKSSIVINRLDKPSNTRLITYSCVTGNVNGNNSAEIIINWPELSKKYENSNRKTIYTRDKDNYTTVSKSKTTYNIFDKRFTLIEMIVAVVATFTITLVLFFTIYRVLIWKVRGKQRNRTHKLYETVQYNDSHTYDVPQTHAIPVNLTKHQLKLSSNNLTTTLSNNNTKTPINTNNSSLPRQLYNQTSPLNNTNNNNNLPYYHPIQCNPIVTPNPYHQQTLPNTNQSVNSPIHYLDFKNPPHIINNDHISNDHITNNQQFHSANYRIN